MKYYGWYSAIIAAPIIIIDPIRPEKEIGSPRKKIDIITAATGSA